MKVNDFSRPVKFSIFWLWSIQYFIWDRFILFLKVSATNDNWLQKKIQDVNSNPAVYQIVRFRFRQLKTSYNNDDTMFWSVFEVTWTWIRWLDFDLKKLTFLVSHQLIPEPLWLFVSSKLMLEKRLINNFGLWKHGLLSIFQKFDYMWHSRTTVLLIVRFQFRQLQTVYFNEIWWSVVFFSIGINEFDESIFL